MTEETNHEPDWEDELVTGETLATCALQLLAQNKPEEVALVLGYKYMDGKGHDQPLVDHLMKAIKEAGVDVDNDEVSRDNMVDIWKGELVRCMDSHGLKIWITKKNFDKNPDAYTHACDFEEVEDWKEFHPEPMMEGDLTMVNYVDKDLEFSEIMDNDEIMEYWKVPSADVHSSVGYG